MKGFLVSCVVIAIIGVVGSKAIDQHNHLPTVVKDPDGKVLRILRHMPDGAVDTIPSDSFSVILAGKYRTDYDIE